MSLGSRSDLNSDIRLTKKTLDEEASNNSLENLLKPVEKLITGSDEDYSDIEDVFEEFHRNSFLRPNADPTKKHLSKTEADWRTVEGFSDEFKRTMADVRKETEVPASIFEEEAAVERILTSVPIRASSSLDPNTRGSPIPIQPVRDDLSDAASEWLA
ncbi:hypothetical protein NQ315_001480 [Exocentrus adspersus]|uniref:Uncharacterized protein n=1 Tax=Exocentrus adspersus TaxID=1586481 RepID=A0AAV8W9N0_9CUCU|nr:hypothetical protein NQ315_001480 [Exocentrus adspersus]